MVQQALENYTLDMRPHASEARRKYLGARCLNVAYVYERTLASGDVSTNLAKCWAYTRNNMDS